MSVSAPARTCVVLDTSTLVADPDALLAFPGCDVVLPLRVIEELDGLKSRSDEAGFMARRALRSIEALRVAAGGSLAAPVNLPAGASLRVEINGVQKHLIIEHGLDPEKGDNRIIGAALGLRTGEAPVKVVSNDTAFRIKAAHLGLDAEEHQPSVKEIGPGFSKTEVDSLAVDELYEKGSLWADELGLPEMENHFAVVTAGTQSAIVRVRDKKAYVLRGKPHPWGLHHRNVEQRFALELLMDPTVQVVALEGPAGTGKSLLAIAAALELVVEQKQFHRFSIFRSLVPVGHEEVGFLPGDLAAKTLPHFAAVFDAVCALTDSKSPTDAERLIEELTHRNQLTMEPITFLRGRSLASSFILVDEATNLERATLKTLLTRVGDGTKIVFTGDTSQIDNPFASASNNALTALIEAFAGQKCFGHVRLTTCERSIVAGLAADLL